MNVDPTGGLRVTAVGGAFGWLPGEVDPPGKRLAPDWAA